MATMKQIADRAGVSRGTVDRVINNRGGVNQETIKRVLHAAEELHYSPNTVARALSARKRRFILTFIMINPQKTPFFYDVEKGALQEAERLRESGVTVVIRHVNSWSESAFIQALDNAVEEGTDGIAFAGLNLPTISRRLQAICDLGIPVVTVNSEISDCNNLAFVGSDSFAAGQVAAGLVRVVQHKPIKLGVVSGFRSSTTHAERYTGLRRGFARMGLPYSVEFIGFNNNDDFDSFDLVKTQLHQHPDVNTLFLATGNGAYGACRAIESMKLPVKPKVICYDSTPMIRDMLKKKIISATICQEPERQGSEPLHILFSYLAFGIKPEKQNIYTKNTIVIRENL